MIQVERLSKRYGPIRAVDRPAPFHALGEARKGRERRETKHEQACSAAIDHGASIAPYRVHPAYFGAIVENDVM